MQAYLYKLVRCEGLTPASWKAEATTALSQTVERDETGFATMQAVRKLTIKRYDPARSFSQNVQSLQNVFAGGSQDAKGRAD